MDGLFIETLFSRPDVYAAVVMTVVLSITFHELAHGYTAIRLGDQTPVWTGHMTWNPLVHMGPMSIAACLLVGISWGTMPFDRTRLRGRHAESYVALAGPLTNLLLAAVALTALGLWLRGGPDTSDRRVLNGLMVLSTFGTTNLLLFVFNLIPVPPLDGWRVASDFHHGYAQWTANPDNRGPIMLLFVGAFIVSQPLAEQLGRLGIRYAQLIAGT